MKELLCCNTPTQPRTFGVILSTDDPKVVELKQLKCTVCEECGSIYVDKKDDLLTRRLVAMGKEMSNVLFGY